MTDTRAIGPVGTAARAVLGGLVIGAAIALEGISWWDVAAVLTVLPAIAIGAAVLVSAGLQRSHPTRWSGRGPDGPAGSSRPPGSSWS